MAAHRKLDQRRDDLCAGGFRLPRPYRSYRYTSGIFRAERDLVIRPYAARKRQFCSNRQFRWKYHFALALHVPLTNPRGPCSGSRAGCADKIRTKTWLEARRNFSRACPRNG